MNNEIDFHYDRNRYGRVIRDEGLMGMTRNQLLIL